MLLNPYRFGESDPYFSQVMLLMHAAGANGSTTFTDSSNANRASSALGNAQIDTSLAKFGTGSIHLDGTGDAVEITSGSAADWALPGDFTIEAFIYKSANGSAGYDAVVSTSNDAGTSWWFELSSTRGFVFYAGFSSLFVTYAMNPNDSAWHHYAIVRSGSTVTLFVDGVSVASATISGNIPATRNLFLGAAAIISGTVTYAMNGYIDELRITVGTARYTANFTPPTAAFPDK